MTSETIEVGLASVGKELSIPVDAPGGKIAYRSTLIKSLFYKLMSRLCKPQSSECTAESFEPMQVYRVSASFCIYADYASKSLRV